MDMILTFIVQHFFIFSASLLVLTFIGIMAAFHLSKAVDHDVDGGKFDLYTHQFGMAYTTSVLKTPIYPTSFIPGSLGGSCHVCNAHGKELPPQWLSRLRRAPEFDLVLKGHSKAEAVLFLQRVSDAVRKRCHQYGADNEPAMAYTAQLIADDLDGRIDHYLNS